MHVCIIPCYYNTLLFLLFAKKWRGKCPHEVYGPFFKCPHWKPVVVGYSPRELQLWTTLYTSLSTKILKNHPIQMLFSTLFSTLVMLDRLPITTLIWRAWLHPPHPFQSAESIQSLDFCGLTRVSLTSSSIHQMMPSLIASSFSGK